MRASIVSIVILASPVAVAAQDEASLKSRIQDHYAAIHAADLDAVADHHLPELTVFPPSGHMLMEEGFETSDMRMGAEVGFPETQVVMRHFAAEIYGDVGVATFYLDGAHDSERGTWRVSAVWIWRDGQWRESHHHESRLIS
jgi:ketosteroid isomerase-like protein